MSPTISRIGDFAIVAILPLAFSSISSAELLIERHELPNLRQSIPLAISSGGSFAITGTSLGNLSRLDMDSGIVEDLRLTLPKRQDLIRVIPNSDLIVFFDVIAHSIIIFDTKLDKQVDAIALPEEADDVVYSVKVQKSDGVPQRRKWRLRDIPASGLWVSRTAQKLLVGFQRILVLVDLPTKVSLTVPSHTLGGNASGVAFSNDDTAFVVCSPVGMRGVSVVDLTTHDRIFDVEGFNLHRQKIPAKQGTFYSSKHLECTQVNWSSDDSIIAGIVYSQERGNLHFWSGVTGQSVGAWSRSNVRLDNLEMLPDGVHCLVCVDTTDVDAIRIVKKEAVLVDMMSGMEITAIELPLAQLRCKGSGTGKLFFFNGSGIAFDVSIVGD